MVTPPWEVRWTPPTRWPAALVAHFRRGGFMAARAREARRPEQCPERWQVTPFSHECSKAKGHQWEHRCDCGAGMLEVRQ